MPRKIEISFKKVVISREFLLQKWKTSTENFLCNSEKLSLNRKTSLRSHDILQWNCIEHRANVLVGQVTDPSKLFNKSLSYSFNNSLLVIIIMTNKLLPVAISMGPYNNLYLLFTQNEVSSFWNFMFNFRSTSNKFPSIFWTSNLHISVPRLGYFF